MLREGPAFFPEEVQTDQSESFLVSEMIREKIFLHTRQELALLQCRDSRAFWRNCPKETWFRFLERSTWNRNLRRGSSSVRRENDQENRTGCQRRSGEFFGSRVFLELLVKVDKNWSRDPRSLRRLGY